MGRHVGSWGGRQGEGDDHGGEWGQELEEEPGGWEERIWRGAGRGGGAVLCLRAVLPRRSGLEGDKLQTQFCTLVPPANPGP